MNLTGLETLLISLGSFVFGVVSGIFAFGRHFVSRKECEAHRDGCMKLNNFSKLEIQQMHLQIRELNKWVRMIAGKLQIFIEEEI